MRNKEKENIDAALVCEDRLREYTWTINEEQDQVVDAVRLSDLWVIWSLAPGHQDWDVCFFCQSDFKEEFGG